jgi:hypothetical protein
VLTTKPVTLAPAGQQGLFEASTFEAGEEITVSAPGGSVPAFTTNLSVPKQAVITSRFDSATVPAGQPLTLTWTGPETGVVRVTAFAGTDGAFSFIVCDLPAGPGIGTISYAALHAFGGGGGVVRIYVADIVELSLEHWTIEVSVGFDAIWPDGSFAQGLLRVE